MAFKIVNNTVLDNDIDGFLDNLTIDGTSVLVGPTVAGNVTLKNVNFHSSITTDNLSEGSTNLYFTDARVQAVVDNNTNSYITADSTDTLTNKSGNISQWTNDAGYITTQTDNQTLSFSNPNLSISNGNSVDLSSLAPNLSGYATEAYVDQAELDAIATASTDATTKDTNLQATITTAYQTYADTAEADAVTTANAYTDTRETAITTAYQTYADQAETDAKLYSDLELEQHIGDSSVDGTIGNTVYHRILASKNQANAYTDSEIVTATSALEAYADQAETDAVTTANAYTDTRETAITTAYQTYADTAEADAKAYTDTEVANLVDSAPAVLDTLNELAAALGDDPNFATTVSNDIGTKVSKAGDTMTGALTLSGAPSSANHAATKAYVDSAVSSGTGALDTDAVPEGSSNLYYTDARADARATLRINAATTDNITEGSSNLYFTNARVDARIPTNVSSFTNDSSYATTSQLFSGSYTDLTNKPTIPTNNNQLTNGAGYVTTNTTYSAGNGISLSSTTFSVAAGNGLTQEASGLKMSGSYTGDFTASGDVTAFSDERLKSNIVTIESALSKVKAMRGVMFDKTDSLSGELKVSTGVIAQEVEQVLPEVVHNDTNTGYKSVAYGNMVGVLIEAIKEQQLQIDELKSQIENLKK